MKLIDTKALATDVITHDVSPLTVNTDAGAYSRLGWLIVIVGVVGFLLWASLAPLDKGVPLMGTVAQESNRKAVQHLAGGTVDDILVKEGDKVQAGQVLVRMNGIQATSQFEISRVQYFTARATEARLIAERDGKASVNFPTSLVSAKSDPRVAQTIDGQNQLFLSRKGALQSELGGLEESIAGLRMQISGLEASSESKREQLSIMKEQLTNLRELSRDGYVARTRLLDLERANAQISGMLSEDIGNIGRARRQISELNMKRSQRQQEFQREVRTQLSEVQREAGALSSRMDAEGFLVKNVEIKSPATGVVMGLNVFTKGGVVPPGFKLMDIVPTGDALVVEGQLPINLVDKVHPGLPVDLIFSAFNVNSTPHIPGEVTVVSADRFVDEQNGMPYYKVSARVTAEGAKLIEKNKLQVRPGMPVELFVKTGERTMMNYLFRPLVDRVKTSMTEE